MQQTPVDDEPSGASQKLSGTDNYYYSRLKNEEFRVLELFPGADADPIRCHLNQYPIDKCPPFEALSYTWGGEERSETIHVNDGSLAVTPNLYSALQELRRDLLQPLPEDSGVRFAVLLDRFNFVSRQRDPPVFNSDGLKRLAECFGHGLGEYITFCASQNLEQSPREGESEDGYASRILDVVGVDKRALDRMLSGRVKLIEELWDMYVTEEGKTIFLRTPRLLWVDAVCINQSDFEERSIQLLVMRKIYKRAKRLVIWLGVEQNGSEKAVDFIISIAMRKGKDESQLRQWIRDSASSPSFAETYVALARFFGRPWFRRTWIVQEYVVGSHNGALFCCGKRRLFSEQMDFFRSMENEFVFRNARVTYGDTFRALSNSGGSQERYGLEECRCHPKDPNETRITTADRILGQIGRHFDLGSTAWAALISLKQAHLVATSNGVQTKDEWLYHWLGTMRRTQSTDPRDKVYATIGLLEDHDKSLDMESGSLIIDYSAPVQDVYSSFVRSVVEKTKRLGILSACTKRGELVRRTWTPDWTQDNYNSILIMRPFKFKYGAEYGSSTIRYNHSASRDLDAVANFSADLNVMTAKGILWGNVDFVASKVVENSAFLSSTFRADCLRFCKSMQLKDDALTEAGAREKLLATLLRDGDPSLPEKWMPDLRDWLEPMESASDAGAHDFTVSKDLLEPMPVSSSNWRTSEFPKLVLYTLWVTRRLILTDKGHIGQAPATTQPGDKVCVVLGCAVPMVLRSVERHWEVVGEAYIHEIMKGEVVNDLENGKVQTQDFELH